MSHNKNVTHQPTTDPPNYRRQLNPDPAGFPSLVRDRFDPHRVDLSSIRVPPLLPPVSLSQKDQRIQHILTQRAAFQPSSHLQPRSTSCSSTSAASQPSSHLHSRSNPFSNTSDASPSSHLQPFYTSSASQPSNNLNTRVTLPCSQPLKRDFSSAFEGLDPSFRQSMERALDPKNSWFPNVPEDAGNRFLMQQSDEDVEYLYRVLALRARLSRDAMVTREARANKAEDQVRSLFSQLGALKAERQSREQAVSFQLDTMRAAIEEERKLRKQADQGREAAVERVKELEGKIAAVERELELAHTDNLEQTRSSMQQLINVSNGWEANVDGTQEHSLGNHFSNHFPVLLEQEQEQGGADSMEQGHADVENFMNVNMGLEANIDELQQNLLRDPISNLTPVEQEQEMRQGHANIVEQGHANMEHLVNANTGLESNVDVPEEVEHSLGGCFWNPDGSTALGWEK